MVTCELCGKECRTAQGLAGHRQWVHRMAPANPQPKVEPATKPAAKLELEGRLELAEVIVEQLAEELITSGEQRAKQLDELQEQVAHHAKHLEEHTTCLNRLIGLHDEVAEVAGRVGQLMDRLDKTIKVINGNKQVYDGMIEKSRNGLDDVRSRLVSPGHDDLKPVPDLIGRVGNLEQVVRTTQSQVEHLALVVERKPTDDTERIRLTDGREHSFRVYKGKRGLSNPHRVSMDPFLGDKYVDLAEPED